MTKKLSDGILVDMTEAEEAEIVAMAAAKSNPAALVKYAKELHWKLVTGGFTFNGIPIKTDDISRGFIIASRLAADTDPQWTTKWGAADGKAYPINAQQMIAISDAIQTYINLLFVARAEVIEKIESGELATLQQIQEYFNNKVTDASNLDSKT